jgi:hypothetical protein
VHDGQTRFDAAAMGFSMHLLLCAAGSAILFTAFSVADLRKGPMDVVVIDAASRTPNEARAPDGRVGREAYTTKTAGQEARLTRDFFGAELGDASDQLCGDGRGE